MIHEEVQIVMALLVLGGSSTGLGGIVKIFALELESVPQKSKCLYHVKTPFQVIHVQSKSLSRRMAL